MISISFTSLNANSVMLGTGMYVLMASFTLMNNLNYVFKSVKDDQRHLLNNFKTQDLNDR